VYYYSETVVKMYSDFEIERWYLGLPFAGESCESEPDILELPRFTDEDVERLFLGFPLLAA
jgi:hypothetical protein